MRQKLIHLSRSSFALPTYSDEKTRNVATTAAENIPMVVWPDGHWCLPANIYVLELYDRGHSRRGLGGTLAAYASNISHLLHYCFERKIEVHELSDGQFTHFISGLREELRGPGGPRVRDDNTVLAVGRNCLDLIQSIAEFRNDPSLIGRDGRIRAFKVKSKRRDRSRSSTSATFEQPHWHHNSFPQADAMRRRFPITSDAMLRLRSAVLTASTSVHQRRRRYAMLQVLEITGGRRIEVAALRVDDVHDALQSPTHDLKLLTAKRRGGKPDYRHVPVAKTDLKSLSDFIDESRKRIIRRTIGLDNDHGFVLVNERTGMPLRPNTITQEVHLLAKAAGFVDVVCPHMFRHRFITKIFVALIERHHFESKSDLRRALLDTESIKQRAMEWTGHKSLESFDRYIDLAFDEVSGYKSSFSDLRDAMELQSIQGAMTQLAEQIEVGETGDGATRLRELARTLARVIKAEKD